MSDLNYENLQIANLVRAMLGSISPNFRAISISFKNTDISLFFLLEKDLAEDREEIDDIVFEFEALQLSYVKMDVKVEINDRPRSELTMPEILIYLRRESDAL